MGDQRNQLFGRNGPFMRGWRNGKPAEAGSNLANFLNSRRRDVADAIAVSLELVPRWKRLANTQAVGRARYLGDNFLALADYLVTFFSEGDPSYRSLLIGEFVKALYDEQLEEDSARAQVSLVMAELRQRFQDRFCRALSNNDWSLLSETLKFVDRVLTSDAPKLHRILFVGDCLFLDIVPFIVAELLERGIRLLPYYATSKNPVTLRAHLKSLTDKKFDLIFYSPVTYEYSIEYEQLSGVRWPRTNRAKIDAIVQSVWSETERTLELLVDSNECPIHVHNVSGVIREESVIKRLAKLAISRATRHRARSIFNNLLTSYIAERNSEAFPRLFLIDENARVHSAGALYAGAYLYKSELQHPAGLGVVLARDYIEIIYASAHLTTKKVVVCDLDNTLWEGVIGEGEVSHFHSRQQLLKSLRAKGVVLTISSKNDPANIHWQGATLKEEDFVAMSINWSAKAQGVKAIRDDLNLKTKDFVFIDDREDERELMKMAFPDLVCLDANDLATWRILELWERTLDPEPEMDRTLMYKQRSARRILEAETNEDSDSAARLSALQLRLTIFPARSNDLRRTAELVNRTNQFNLEGSRTTVREITQWFRSENHVILLGQSADRFGDMGTTCIAIAECTGDQMKLLSFVLSCRVFGYGIENAVLGALKRIARRRSLSVITGRYIKTAVNAPCERFLPDNDFVLTEDRWEWSAEIAIKDNPAWLSVIETYPTIPGGLSPAVAVQVT